MVARLPSHLDVEFKPSLAAGIAPAEKGLIERSEANVLRSVLPGARVRRLRAAQRTIAGLKGDELVRRYVENDGAVVYSFWWEVSGKEDGVFTPHTVLMMDTGLGGDGPVPSPLSEDAATVLWDAVTSSVRSRPSIR
jgi:hypothetical protein